MLNRVALTITRKQPYVDWANGTDGPVPAVAYPEDDRRTIYLAFSGCRMERSRRNYARRPAVHLTEGQSLPLILARTSSIQLETTIACELSVVFFTNRKRLPSDETS